STNCPACRWYRPATPADRRRSESESWRRSAPRRCRTSLPSVLRAGRRRVGGHVADDFGYHRGIDDAVLCTPIRPLPQAALLLLFQSVNLVAQFGRGREVLCSDGLLLLGVEAIYLRVEVSDFGGEFRGQCHGFVPRARARSIKQNDCLPGKYSRQVAICGFGGREESLVSDFDRVVRIVPFADATEDGDRFRDCRRSNSNFLNRTHQGRS